MVRVPWDICAVRAHPQLPNHFLGGVLKLVGEGKVQLRVSPCVMNPPLPPYLAEL